MLHALGELIGRELRCRDNARAGRVTGFVIDDAAWALRYARVRLVDDEGVERVLPTAAFPPLLKSGSHLSACLTPAELARGLPLAGPCEALTRADEAAVHDALHWMPYWRGRGNGARAALHDAGAAIGAELHCGGEPFGRIADLLVDTREWTVPAVRILTLEPGASGHLHLPTAFLRSTCWERGRFDSDVRAAALACAPASPRAVPGSDHLNRLFRHLSDERSPP